MSADHYLLRQHVKKTCRPNLEDSNVICCATCPFEDEIIETYPELEELFIAKRCLKKNKNKSN